MALDYLQIFHDKRELLEPFTREEKGELLDAMMAYAFDDVEIDMETNAKYIWRVFKKMIDQSKKAFEAKSNAGKSKAKKNASECYQTSSDAIKTHQNASDAITSDQNVSKGEQTESNDPINQESRIKNQDTRYKSQDIRVINHEVKGDEVPPTPHKAQKRFTAPTVEEVAAYCRERGNRVEAQRFVDFYTAKGWRVGSSPMKDWRAAVRNWETRDNAPMPTRAPKVVTAQCYTQRKYTEDEMSGAEVDIFAAAKELKERGTG